MTLMLSRISCAVKSIFVPHSNSTTIIESPSCEAELTVLTFFTLLTAASMGLVTSVSISSDATPS